MLCMSDLLHERAFNVTEHLNQENLRTFQGLRIFAGGRWHNSIFR